MICFYNYYGRIRLYKRFLCDCGLLKSQKPMATERLAAIMAEKAVSERNGLRIFGGSELKRI